jgi:hypothetical protein
MNKFFDIKKLIKDSEPIISEKKSDDSGVEDLEDGIYKSILEKNYIVINRVEEIGLPVPGEHLHVVTFRAFNAVHFLYHVAKKYKLEHVLIAVYSINHEAAILIDKMIKKELIGSATILISNLRNKAHREKEQLTRDMFVANPKIDLFFIKSHAKIIATKSYCGQYFAISGSGNFSYNSKVEQYEIDNDKGLYEFTENWFKLSRELLKGTKELVET